MAITFFNSNLASLHEVNVLICQIILGFAHTGHPDLQSVGISRDCHVPQLQLTSTPRRHLAGCTYSHGRMYGNCAISLSATFKAPSQLAAIFYLYSDIAGEARKPAAILSVALQFPQFWHWFPKRFIWKLFCNLSEGKKEAGKLSSFRKPQKKRLWHPSFWNLTTAMVLYQALISKSHNAIKRIAMQHWLGWVYKQLRSQGTAQGRLIAEKQGCVFRDAVHINPEKKGHNHHMSETQW